MTTPPTNALYHRLSVAKKDYDWVERPSMKAYLLHVEFALPLLHKLWVAYPTWAFRFEHQIHHDGCIIYGWSASTPLDWSPKLSIHIKLNGGVIVIPSIIQPQRVPLTIPLADPDCFDKVVVALRTICC